MGEPIRATHKTKNQSIGQREKNSMVLRGKQNGPEKLQNRNDKQKNR